jgi:dTDP-4-amino-4,6-dideoxygalactose transaminase
MNDIKRIPFLDLVSSHIELEDELVGVFREALRSGAFVGGSMVQEFEKDFAIYCDSKYCVGVNSGTDALRFALLASGVKHDDTVITVPNSFIATTEAVSQAGAFIEFIDIDSRTYNIDTEKLREYLEIKCYVDDRDGKTVDRRTNNPVTAIIPVHLYGQMADMDGILELARKYNLIVIEDACQAHGAEYFSEEENRWRKAGSVGRAAAFSFYPGKNLGACGEGGAITTDDENVAETARMLRDHGQAKKYFHDIEGYNGRLDALQAGILRAKLKYLPQWNDSRRRCAYRYNDLLESVHDVTIPYEPACSKAVYHLYVIRNDRRDSLQKYLSENKVATGLHYPLPLHLQKAYLNLGYKKGDFPVSEKAASEILSLPMYPGIADDQQRYIVEKIKEWPLKS